MLQALPEPRSLFTGGVATATGAGGATCVTTGATCTAGDAVGEGVAGRSGVTTLEAGGGKLVGLVDEALRLLNIGTLKRGRTADC